ncbi:MAG: TerC family protein [Firmicutes bacterium]|nr:TerC family protein [Bacillota bacterium]
MEFITALFSIIIIDIVLGGDNAIVIAMASRRLPAKQRKKAVILGTMGAVAVRSALTGAALFLLRIPYLLLAGGLLLIWIAVKLLHEQRDDEREIQAGSNMWEAIKIIVVADLIMGIDNVIGVAGAAHGDFLLLIAGLAISIPVIVWGSTFILSLMEKYPVIIFIGAAVLAWTAGKMITEDILAYKFLAPHIPFYETAIPLTVTALVILNGIKNNEKIAD